MPRSTQPSRAQKQSRTGKKAAAKRATRTGKAAAKTTKAAPKKAPARRAVAKKAAPKKAVAKKAAPRKAAPKKAAVKKGASTKAPAEKVAKRAVKKPLDKFLEGQRKALLEERSVYTRQAETLRAEAEQLAQDWERGDATFTEDEGGEGDSINVERERDLALSAQALMAIEDIDRALGKIDVGTYGICESCGEKIPRERLKAVPQAALCVRCKTGGLGRR
jgi:DnaK suppressor protein